MADREPEENYTKITIEHRSNRSTSGSLIFAFVLAAAAIVYAVTAANPTMAHAVLRTMRELVKLAH